MTTPTEVVVEVALVLEHLRIPYLIVGSFASSARGITRATMDADIVAQITEDQVQDVVKELSSRDYYVDDLAVRRAIINERAFNAIHRDSAFKVDIFVRRDEFSKNQLERKLAENILPDSDAVVYIATAEDTIVAKLVWFRKGGESSDRQWSDVLGVLKIQHARLDYEYMQHWCELLGVADLLSKALAEVSR
ncbi:MAG TPA: hypothetical protein VJT71_15920 [Pyrinomonadaceae bacterium]|nr:hypothetical protein [Pyrinomonadaceae bacterium]